MAVFSNTTTKAGLIQIFEFWTGQKDGTVTGSSTANATMRQTTARINAAFEKIMPLLLAHSDYIRWDDLNHTDRPIGRTNLVSGQADYKITEDDNSLDILNIISVRILQSSGGTEYQPLDRLTMEDERVLDAMSPNPSITGIPTHFVENGNHLFLYPEPNYAATSGIELFFSREQSYFVNTDTTKEPGIPKPFHELLALYPALDWIVVNRSDKTNLIRSVQGRIAEVENGLSRMIALRNPTRIALTMKGIPFR